MGEMVRQTADGGNVTDVAAARARFGAAVRKRLEELHVEREGAESWIVEQFEKLGRKPPRWQTAQFWIEGKSFALGWRLRVLAQALRMRADELVGEMDDEEDDAYPAWAAFLETAEGRSMTASERWKMRLFTWENEPTTADYRGLLALIRNNADRS